MMPLRIVIITKTDPLKRSLPKFAQPGAGCLVTLFRSYNQFYRAECITVSGFFTLIFIKDDIVATSYLTLDNIMVLSVICSL